jgi:hypothetical protein
MMRGRVAFVGARAIILVGLVALTTSGCVAAGLATAPLMSVVQLVGARSIERTVAGELGETLAATEAVLARMAFGIEHRERADGVRRLRASVEDLTVHVTLERVTGKLTRVALRVETGGLLADRDTGVQIYEQIVAALAPATARVPLAEPGTAEALTTLQGEIRKLRSEIEERRPADRSTPAVESGPSMRLEPGAIVTVPMSAALPTVGGPAPAVVIQPPASAAPSATVAGGGTSDAGTTRHQAETSTALRPAAALTPIQPMKGEER